MQEINRDAQTIAAVATAVAPGQGGIAVIRVCEHLLESKAIGAISTHDLELAEADKIRSRCRTVHFREFFEQNPAGQQEMKFDYLMRQGTSPTTNALKLLEMVGLGWKEDPPGADSGKSG